MSAEFFKQRLDRAVLMDQMADISRPKMQGSVTPSGMSAFHWTTEAIEWIDAYRSTLNDKQKKQFDRVVWPGQVVRVAADPDAAD